MYFRFPVLDELDLHAARASINEWGDLIFCADRVILEKTHLDRPIPRFQTTFNTFLADIRTVIEFGISQNFDENLYI